LNELVEIGVGEHTTHAHPAMADIDVAERAGSDVAVECLDRTVEPPCSLRRREQGIWRRRSQIFLGVHPRAGDRNGISICFVIARNNLSAE